jgi:signal transduction histidine kinase
MRFAQIRARLRSFSVRAKLIAMVMVTTCVALALAGAALAVFEVVSHRRALAKEVATVAAVLAENSTAALTFDNAHDAENVLGALASQPNVISACLYAADAQLFAVYLRAGAGAGCPPDRRPDRAGFVPEGLIHHQPVVQAGRTLGNLRVLATVREIEQRIELFALVLLAALTGAALAALALSSALQRLVSRPILDLSATATRISERQDYTLRAPRRTQDELGLAVDAFNQMLDRIQEAHGALRDASENNREQAQLLQSILDNMGEGMIACDASGVFVVWNRAATRLLGEGPAPGSGLSEWAGRFGLYAADGRTPLPSDHLPLGRALRGQSVTDQEIFVRRPDREAEGGRWFSSTARPMLDDDGTLRGAITVFRDVTERRRAEEELRALNATLEQRVTERTEAAEQRAAELKRSNEDLERFAYVASHDLQEPLRAVASYTQLLQSRLSDKLDDETRTFLDYVLGGAARMRALIHDLLDYSRVGREPMARAHTQVNLDEVLDAALEDLAAAVSESGAEIRRGPLPTVRGDPAQLVQLLRNLIANAIRFRSEAPPAIDVRAERLSGERAGLWQVSVKDNGIGIEPRHHERIFVIFQRLHGRERPGTGIGLAICKKIVELHGGSIWVDSAPGQGATFHFTLAAGPEGAS